MEIYPRTRQPVLGHDVTWAGIAMTDDFAAAAKGRGLHATPDTEYQAYGWCAEFKG
jgi:hypothetical protein